MSARRVSGERRASISVLRRFRRVIRRTIERWNANHPYRDASSSGSGHRTAAQVGHVLETQPHPDGFAVRRVTNWERMPEVVIVAARASLLAVIDALLLLAGASLSGGWEERVLTVP
jgi:hypothetical protein